MIKKFYKFSAINEGPAKRKYTDAQINSVKKITEYCEDYVLDILDDCRNRGIITTSYTIPSGVVNYEWNLIIKEYYPIKIYDLIKKISLEFEVEKWWIESSGTSSEISKIQNITKLTLSLFPKNEL